MTGQNGDRPPKLSSLIGHFAGHVIFGFVGFIIVAVPAIMLSLAAYYLERLFPVRYFQDLQGTGMSSEPPVSLLVIHGLVVLEQFILAVDAVTFIA